MSLRVWLPLDGDLHNQGVSDLQFSYSGTNFSIDSNGKIGSCYKRTARAADAIISDKTINLGSHQSMFCWIKMDAFNSSSNLTGILGQHRHPTNTGMGITLKYKSATTGQLSVNTGTGSARTFVTYLGSTTLTTNTWYHVGYTYDGTTIKLYVNGIKDGSHAFSGMSCPAEYIQIGNWAFNSSTLTTTTIANYCALGSINDVRIYDHCLSATEVREIAQGLVLHYPLNRESLKPIGTNLVTGVTKGGQTSLLTDGRVGVVTSGTSADTYFTVNLSESITSGTTYYLSCDVSGVSDGQYWGFPLGAQSNTSMPSKFYNGHNVYIFTANDINWGTNRLFLDDNYRNDYAHPASFYNFVLIKNPTFEEFDCSGYNRNGTFNNIINIVSDTARYSSAIEFPGTSYIKLTSPSTEVKTVSLWAKWNTIPSGQSIIYVDQKSKTGLGLASNGIIVNTNQSGHTFNKSSLVANTWYHFVIVSPNGSSNATRQLYINGVEQTALSSTNSWSYTIDELQLGKRSTSSDGFNGKISDFRMYCVALTADDILALYHTGAKIDNKQNLHTFELIETNKQQITKQGQTNGQNLLETYLPLYDKTIYTEPDGSTWIHIFHHNNPANSKFNNTTTDWTTGKYLDADRWYDVDHAIYYTLGPYEFMLKQKTTSSATETKYRWTQAANPLTAVWNDVKPGTVTFNTSSGYTNSSYGGMYLFKNTNLHMCIANGSNGNWYGGIGAATDYNGGIPGFPNTTVTSGYIDLYLRVYVNTKMIKNIGISSLEFIEL